MPLRSQGWPRKLSNYSSWSPWTCAVSFHPLWLSRRPSIAAFHTAIQPLSAAPTIPELVSSQGIIQHAPQGFYHLPPAKELIRLTYSTTSLIHTSCVGLLNPLLGGCGKSCYNHGDYPSWDVNPSLRASRSTSWISGCISGFLAASAANSKQSQLGSSEPY